MYVWLSLQFPQWAQFRDDMFHEYGEDECCAMCFTLACGTYHTSYYMYIFSIPTSTPNACDSACKLIIEYDAMLLVFCPGDFSFLPRESVLQTINREKIRERALDLLSSRQHKGCIQSTPHAIHCSRAGNGKGVRQLMNDLNMGKEGREQEGREGGRQGRREGRKEGR